MKGWGSTATVEVTRELVKAFAGRQQQRTDVIFAHDLRMFDRAYQVIARRPFTHALRQYLADDVAGRHPEAGVTLHIKGVGTTAERADLREEIGPCRHR